MEDYKVPEVLVDVKVDQDAAIKKRKCSCTIGERDEKTGQIIPPNKLKKGR